MPLLVRISSLWRNLFQRGRMEQELAKEIRAHAGRCRPYCELHSGAESDEGGSNCGFEARINSQTSAKACDVEKQTCLGKMWVTAAEEI
jgi:hypothetical protein